MISVGVAIVGTLIAGVWVLLNRMDSAIDKLRIELKAEIADSETRRKEDTASIRNEIAKLRIELKAEIADSETRRKEDTAMIRNDIASIREDIKELRSTVNNLGQRVARVEALLIKDLAELAIDPTQVASESPEVEAGVAEPGPAEPGPENS